MSFTSDQSNILKDNLNYISYQDIYIDSDIESYPDHTLPILDTDSLSNSSKISYNDEPYNQYSQNKSFDADNFSISSAISATPSVYNTIQLDSYNRNMYNKRVYNRPQVFYKQSAIYDRTGYKKNIIEQNTYFNKDFYQIMFNYIIFNSK